MTTLLRAPRVIVRREDAVQINYYETDLICTNVKPSLLKQYGWPTSSGPVVWQKFNNAMKRADENVYFVSLNKGCEMIVNAGNGSQKGAFFGKDVDTSSWAAGDIPRFNNASITYDLPNYSQRGVVSGVMTNTSERLSIGSGGQMHENLSAEEILDMWNAYVTAESQSTILGDTKKLYFHSRRGGTETMTQIKTLEDLKKAFPRYFQFAEQFKGETLIELATGDKSNFIFQGVVYPTSYVGLWDSLAKTLGPDGVLRELSGRQYGYSSAQIAAIRALSGKTIADLVKTGGVLGGGGGGGGGGGSGGTGSGGGSNNAGGRNASGQPWLGPEGYEPGKIQTITVARSAGVFFTADEIAGLLPTQKNIKFSPRKPVMYQIYPTRLATSSSPRDVLANSYVFDFAPSEIAYSGFGGEWMQIDRAGGFPFVDWKSFKLLQVSFTFLIAANTSPGGTSGRGAATGDGLDLPVTQKIEDLQRMAQTPFPVMFYGLDALLSKQFRYDASGKARGIQFVIQDLSINALRRNSDLEITRAQASITLQEIPVEKQTIIGMPRLRHKPVPPERKPDDETEPEFGLFEEGLTSKPDAQINFQNT